MKYEKIKVLHFELDSNLGGIETFLLNVLKNADKSNIQFEFVTSAKEAALEDDFKKEGAIIHHISEKRNVVKYLLDVKNLLRNNYDVVHFHKNSAANILPLIVCKICGVENIFIHSHNTSPSQGGISKVLHTINKRALNKLAKKKYACSTEAGRWMYYQDDYKVLRNGIITKRFIYSPDERKRVRAELGIGEDVLVVGHVGRFTPQKNHTFLIDIFKELLDIHDNAMLLLVGTGELEESVRKKIIKLSIERNVLLLGNRNNIPELMMAMDAFVMPSLYEGLPIVAIEAQASGLNLFLSDAISKETEITNAVKWFSLDSTATTWAKTIVESCNELNLETRLQRNKQVVSNKYDIDETVFELQKDYIDQGGKKNEGCFIPN